MSGTVDRKVLAQEWNDVSEQLVFYAAMIMIICAQIIDTMRILVSGCWVELTYTTVDTEFEASKGCSYHIAQISFELAI